MKRHHWKRLLIGWILIGMLLCTPAIAQYCYYGSCSPGDDDGPGIGPWMILVFIFYYVLSAGGLEGCTTDLQSDSSSP